MILHENGNIFQIFSVVLTLLLKVTQEAKDLVILTPIYLPGRNNCADQF